MLPEISRYRALRFDTAVVIVQSNYRSKPASESLALWGVSNIEDATLPMGLWLSAHVVYSCRRSIGNSRWQFGAAARRGETVLRPARNMNSRGRTSNGTAVACSIPRQRGGDRLERDRYRARCYLDLVGVVRGGRGVCFSFSFYSKGLRLSDFFFSDLATSESESFNKYLHRGIGSAILWGGTDPGNDHGGPGGSRPRVGRCFGERRTILTSGKETQSGTMGRRALSGVIRLTTAEHSRRLSDCVRAVGPVSAAARSGRWRKGGGSQNDVQCVAARSRSVPRGEVLLRTKTTRQSFAAVAKDGRFDSAVFQTGNGHRTLGTRSSF